MSKALWVLVTVVLVIAAYYFGRSGGAKSEESNEHRKPRLVKSHNAPFSACPQNGRKHAMGPVCTGSSDKTCEVDLDYFKNPPGGPNHELDPACAVWASFQAGSMLKITDHGPSASPFQITFQLEPESADDDGCKAVKYANPFSDVAVLSAAQTGNTYTITTDPLKPTAINCHFKMTLTQGNQSWDPHIYGDM